ncbi:MAG: hypothetical protein EPO35_05930 [Acidobacteria bacterium]|nr:MAG: hypothetical protein EPO35_05930 [Acidobacteriota bacterium]
MAEFQVRSDAVDVEQIMRQIRARIREKRGADYTEQEIRELANVKLEKFLDPRGIRSNLVQEFRRNRVITPAPQTVGIGDVDVFGSPRPMLRSIRKLLSPILRLFFSPTPMVHAINTMQKQQNEVNAEFHRRFRQREEMDPLYYEVIHNLVVELTRLSIENQNLKMRVESLSSRMDFDERRARALETVVAYKPAPRPERIERPQPSAAPAVQTSSGDGQAAAAPAQTNQDPQRAGLEPRDQGERGERRRRRRRRRRPGQNMGQQGPGSNGQSNVQGSVQGPGSGSESGTFDGGRSDDGRSASDDGDSDE